MQPDQNSPAPLRRLNARVVEKPWGRRGLLPQFAADPERLVGEIWFEPPDGRPHDVLIKYLFTSERLSIQVHPDDAMARARGERSGKDECWIVVEATEEAEIGLGTVRPLSPDELTKAARDGSIVDLIDWRRPRVGDFIYNPAGTIHAIGPGLTLVEVQQAVDCTYRLYDYGRPRDLHLDEAREAANARPHRNPLDGPVGDNSRILVDGPKFGLAWCVGKAPPLPVNACDIQLLPIDAPVGGVGEGGCAMVDRHQAGDLRSDGRFILAWSIG